MEPVYRVLVVIAHTLLAVIGVRPRVENADRLPATGGAVLAANHTAYLDFIGVGLAGRAAGRFVRFMLKAEAAKMPIMRFLVRQCKAVPVDRFAGADAYAAAVQSLSDGEVVGVYPEATISRSFEIKKLKSGAARMALEANVPIVPVIVWGMQRKWTKGQPRHLRYSRTPMLVRLGDAIAPTGDAESLTAQLRTRMQDLLEQVQLEYGTEPAGAPWLPVRLGGSAPTLAEADKLDADELAAKAAARAEKAK
ncbi:lysophospholipid acyltransferase family protein [Jongsikchunia kroppenstedtii]|uniref:lysophospholipid acyltransferase family protein n=1 Tax=Jongsikchunia kroppenstedtii TaxID=1121721 RepID=UPI00036940F8|nr:lysophospholipid acyltransferase family protein [Jongsikchunia kroppenstedtii]